MKNHKDFKKPLALVLGLLSLVLPVCFDVPGLGLAGEFSLGVFLFAAIFWVLEPIPIYATSMSIIFLQVLFLSDKSLFFNFLSEDMKQDFPSQKYGDFYASLSSPIIMLFLGGFALAAAAVKFDLDKNLTRVLLKPFGRKPHLVALGLMIVTAILSAFMSNTATTAMMITVALPIFAQLDEDDPFRKFLCLAVPVSANIGGKATPIGTPPNAIALAALEDNGVSLSFTDWILINLPLVVAMLIFSWFLLRWMYPPKAQSIELRIEGRFDRSKKAIIVYVVFAITVLLWLTEKLHGIPSTIIAFLPVAMLPAFEVLNKKDIRGFSWEVLWLVAGGISLGLSLKQTGLANWFVALVDWSSLGGFGIVFVFCLIGFIIANIVSHTVSATILMPLIVSTALAQAEILNFTVAVLTVGVIVSFAMILPISTPPNAIAMTTGMFTTKDLARVGAVVGLGGFVLTLFFGQFIWPIMF